MPGLLGRRSSVLVAVGAVLPLGLWALSASAPLGASAQSATGSITGHVRWTVCARVPLPVPADGSGSGAAPEAQSAQPAADAQSTPDTQATPGVPPGVPQPVPVPFLRSAPAGNVLVAVQNTALSARTDDAGAFTLSGVPAGQYLTVAAGPAANTPAAVAARPNVFLSGGQSVDVGTLLLGGGTLPSVSCLRGPGPATDTPAPDSP
jgi:hypothetical protein